MEENTENDEILVDPPDAVEQPQSPGVESMSTDDQASLILRLMMRFDQMVGKAAPPPFPDVAQWFKERFIKLRDVEAKPDEVQAVLSQVRKAFKQFEKLTPEPRDTSFEYQYHVFRLSIAALVAAKHSLIEGGGSALEIKRQAQIAVESFIGALTMRAVLMAGLVITDVIKSMNEAPVPQAPRLILPGIGDVAAINQGRDLGQGRRG